MCLFKEECRKILGKRIVWIWAAALTGAIGIYTLFAAGKKTGAEVFDAVLLEGGMLQNIGILLIVIIGLAPVFAEEYSLKTASLLLTSAHGRKKDVQMKVLASVGLAGGFYLLESGALLLLFLSLYGSGPLLAEAVHSELIAGFSSFTCGEVWLLNLFWGLLGIWMMAALTLFFSAKCSTPFLTLIWSLVCLAAAAVLLNIAPVFMNKLPLYVLLTGLGKWSPLYLPLTFGWGIGQWEMPWRLFYVIGIISLCLYTGQRLYKKHEA